MSLSHLFSRKSNRKRRKELFVITRSKSTFVGVRIQGFTCYEYRESASNAYNCGGVARWCEEGTRRKLPDRINVLWQGPEKKFHETAARPYMKIGYEVHDAFTADVYYHNSCYIEFTQKKNGANSRWDCWITWEWYTWQVFVSALKKRLVHEKDAFLLSNLLEDIKRLSELSEMAELLSNTRTLRRRIIDKFSDDVSFYPKDKYLIVRSSNVNPCKYVLAILEGKGLKDYDTIK